MKSFEKFIEYLVVLCCGVGAVIGTNHFSWFGVLAIAGLVTFIYYGGMRADSSDYLDGYMDGEMGNRTE